MSSDSEKTFSLSFEALADLCLKHRCFQSPSLFHGVLTGQLCATERLPREQWLLLFGQLLGQEAALQGEERQLALELLDQTLEQLGSGQMNFEPLLPDDLYELEERFAALIKWLQGFLKSVKAAGLEPETLSEEAREGLEDLGSILAVGDQKPMTSEENEKDLYELTEFVRLVAMLVYTERHPGKPRVDQAATNTRLQ